ncbi:MAG: type II toxin-antitoxin system prevent-host-death family antitoxin [Ignavibacteria bacterium]|nr:type II toxin-antitoxin system prevent-host-death family antitoxin [Ignavibacteria bacterium]
MYLTAENLKTKTNEIIEKASQGKEYIVTMKGKPYAKIIPYREPNYKKQNINENKLFGIWSDRKDIKDVNKYVRQLRKER